MALVACGAEVDSGGNCTEHVAAANVFIEHEDNLSCRTDADCVVESTGCAPVKGAYCAQIGLKREAAESAAWQELSGQLDACAEDDCAVCGALLLPSCSNGLCFTPRDL
jgi:hypothetical protein